MVSYLEANLREAECIAHHRRTGQMVPIARGGTLVCLINRRRLDSAPLATPLSAEDYVIGLELLGFTFTLWTPFEGAPDGVLRGEPAETLPAGWDR